MSKSAERKIKCVVWDLDDTLWDGILAEDAKVALRPDVVKTLHTLDERGILLSIASKNDEKAARAQLEAFGLWDLFLYPQISWNPKSDAVRTIAESINIGLDAVAFVDDQRFELDEVAFSLPQVLGVETADRHTLLDRPEFNPRFLTDDSRRRRQLYRSDIIRNEKEQTFQGPKEDFLASLGMVLTISPAAEDDLQRAEELTVRTHQLNTTGRAYSYEELDHFRRSPGHQLLMASLEDSHGPYGKIGLVLIERAADAWTILLLLMSCRVMSRGVGSAFLNHIRAEAARHNVDLLAHWVPNERNRMMYMTYKFGGFREWRTEGDLHLLQNDLSQVPPPPSYLRVLVRP